MHPTIPTIVAFTQYLCEIYLFKSPKFNDTYVPISLIFVMVSTALLLINFHLYPKDLRKLFPCAEHLLQYLINVLVFEYIIACVWLPLEEKLIEIIPSIGQFLDEMIQEFDGDCDVFCEIVQSDYVRIITSCLFSFFILVCVLHATKIIDLRLLECGVTFFIGDIKYRSKRRWKNVRKSFIKPPAIPPKNKRLNSCEKNNKDDKDKERCD